MGLKETNLFIKKHYVAIAKVFAAQASHVVRAECERHALAKGMMQVFAKDNRAFKPDTFILAAKLDFNHFDGASYYEDGKSPFNHDPDVWMASLAN